MTQESLGPAEKIIQTLLSYPDHLVHNRPGIVRDDATSVTGVKWFPATWKEQGGQKVVYQKIKSKKPIQVGVLWNDMTVRNPDTRQKICEFRNPGIFEEVAKWMYEQSIQIWKVDAEFAARWASYQFMQDDRGMKIILAALMLVQSRKGDPVRDDSGKVLFPDDDFRDVGEAMALIYSKQMKGLDPKSLLRVYKVLTLDSIAAINREHGFTSSEKNPCLGRWPAVVKKWLRHRERNLPLLHGLMKAGYKSTVQELCRKSHYKPESPLFFEILGWKQKQSSDGHRILAIGKEFKKETWEGLSEEQICEKIIADKPNYKRITSMLPKEVGLTQAIMAASIEAGSLSDKDLVILSPTLEEMGLLNDPDVKKRWEEANRKADDLRAANIAARMKGKEAKETLEQAADAAMEKSLEEETKNIRTYVFVDRSSSMDGAIDAAKELLAKFLGGFPPDRIHVSAFSTVGREVKIKHPSRQGVEASFKGIQASGGTNYGAGVLSLQGHRPKDDEDVLFIFIGDEEDNNIFDQEVRVSNLRPMAFGLVRVLSQEWITKYHGYGRGSVVRDTASRLQIPCFQIDENTFDDVYAIPRTIRNLVASTPVGRLDQQSIANRTRETLVEKILKTELLQKPSWAA